MKKTCQRLAGKSARRAWAALSLCLALLARAASGQDRPVPKSDAGATAAPRVEALKTDNDKLSYALGMAYGNEFRKQSLEVNPALFTQGMNDARAGAKTLLADGEARALVVSLQEEMRRKQLALQAERLKAENEAAEQNRKDGEAYLAANKSKEGVVTLPSGLQYKVLKAGDGKKPTLEDTVICHYRGCLIDGTEFDSSYKEGKEPPAIPLKGVIAGWSEALQLMPVGSKWQLFVPAPLAYGARAAGRTFGPNSALVFEVELLGIEDKAAPAAKTAKLSKAR